MSTSLRVAIEVLKKYGIGATGIIVTKEGKEELLKLIGSPPASIAIPGFPQWTGLSVEANNFMLETMGGVVLADGSRVYGKEK